MDQVRLTGQLRCRSQEEVRVVAEHLPTHIGLTRAEPGGLRFDVTATNDANIWQVDELFISPAAFRAHQARVAARAWGTATAWRAPALVLSRAQRRSLMRQVLAKDVVDPAVLPLTRDVAARLVRGAQPLLLVGLVLQQAGQVLTMNSRWYTVFFAVFWAFAAVLGVWTWLRVRTAGRFLAAHTV